MAPKKSVASKSSSSIPFPYVSRLIRDCNIPNTIQIRPITVEEENRWRIEGLDDNLLVLGKKHIEMIHLPIHPMILQFLFAL